MDQKPLNRKSFFQRKILPLKKYFKKNQDFFRNEQNSITTLTCNACPGSANVILFLVCHLINKQPAKSL